MDELIKRITSGNVPAAVLGVVGIILLLLAFKAFKGFIKIVFLLVALALFAGAAWWHFHQH